MPKWYILLLVAVVVVAGLSYVSLVGEMAMEFRVGVWTATAMVLVSIVAQVFTRQREIEARQSEHRREIEARQSEHRREIEARQFEDKRKIYEGVLDVYANLMRQNIPALGKPRKKLNEQQVANELFDLKCRILLWSGRDVIDFWLAMTEGAADNASSATDPIEQFDQFIRLMREELGQDNSGIETGDLISVFLVGVGTSFGRAGLIHAESLAATTTVIAVQACRVSAGGRFPRSPLLTRIGRTRVR